MKIEPYFPAPVRADGKYNRTEPRCLVFELTHKCFGFCGEPIEVPKQVTRCSTVLRQVLKQHRDLSKWFGSRNICNSENQNQDATKARHRGT